MSYTDQPAIFSTVFKEDCEKCEIPSGVKGGGCPILKEKNPVLSENSL